MKKNAITLLLGYALYIVGCGKTQEKIIELPDVPVVTEPCTSIDFGKSAHCPAGFVCLPKNTGLVLSGGDCAPSWYFAVKSEVGASDISCLDEEGEEVLKYNEASKSRWYWCGKNGGFRAVTRVPGEPPNAFRLWVIGWGVREQFCPQEEGTGFCNPVLLSGVPTN